MFDCTAMLAKNQVLGRLGMLDDEEDLGVTFLTPTISCSPSFKVSLPKNELATDGIYEVAFIKNGYGRPCVILQGDCASEGGYEGRSTCWVAAIEEEDVPAVKRLFEWAVSEDPFDPEAFGCALGEHLVGRPTMSLWGWCGEDFSILADVFDRIEMLMIDRSEWQGLEGSLEVVTDEGDVLSLPLRQSTAYTPLFYRFCQRVPYEAQLPFACRTENGWETQTLFVTLERRRADDHSSWDAWSLYLSVLGVSMPEGREYVLGRACMAHRANNVKDLFAEMRPVPLWLVRKFFEKWNSGWYWAKEAGAWVNAERDEWLSWCNGGLNWPNEDGEPYAREEDAFWERVEPSGWREG